jgi:hypothetical protein
MRFTMCPRLRALALFVFAGALPSTVAAQAQAPVGVRAAGMGGAFTAVADDASATFWNPAGLASGSFFSLAIDRNSLSTPDDTRAPHARSGLLVTLGTPPLGLSFTRTRLSRTAPATAEQAAGRNTAGGDLRLETLVTQQAGITLVQSLWRSVALGATVKYVHGVAATALVSSTAALDAAGDLAGRSSSTVDADIGVMAAGSFAKAGLAMRNVRQPSFASSDGAEPIRLERQVRAGVSLHLVDAVTVAADADLTRATTSAGRWRDAAIGVESKLLPSAWARAGVHWNTAGGGVARGSAPIVSIGGSYAVHGSALADVQVSLGSSAGDRGWGVGLRFVY